MTDRNKILQMITNMSRLKEDAGAFQGEIATASAKIQELMEKYAISQMDVDNFRADQQEREFKAEFKNSSSEHIHKNVQEWEWSLARLIATITMTRHYSSGVKGRTRMVFFGVPENARTASELYTLWHDNIKTMADQAQDENYYAIRRKYGYHPNFVKWLLENTDEEDTRYYRASWLSGCLSAMHMNVYNENKKRETERESGNASEQKVTSALVLYKAEVDKAYAQISSNFKPVSNRGSSGSNSAGYTHGQKVGSKIKIGSKELGG